MTVRSSTILASCAVVALSVAVAPLAHASSTKPEIGYFLSRTDVAVSVAMTLTSCPSDKDELPGVDVEWKVEPTASADTAKQVRVDVSSGFLAKRSNAFEFYPNGTLAEFNGSSEGQGGPFLVSVLKTVATLAPLASPSASGGPKGEQPPEDPPEVTGSLYCRDGVVGKLKQLADTKAVIRKLEDTVLAHTPTSADLDLLERQRLKKSAQIKALTFAEGVSAAPASGTERWTGRIELPKLLGNWFSPTPGKEPGTGVAFDSAKVAGLDGFDVSIESIGDVLADGTAPATSDRVSTSPPKAPLQRSLVYRRPVHAEVIALDTNCRPVRDCYETLVLDGPLPIGQWGKVSSLPVGNAGLFGSREASASFDPFGTPLKLSYGSDSGAADIGSTIEAAGGTVTAIADSESAALERKIKREELRQKLSELRAAADE